jgi:vesicular inhibitory amino acid transporter
MLGLLSLLNLTVALLVDGFGSKTSPPGSLLYPSPTSILPPAWNLLPNCFGLFMAGFSGHACFPGLFASMHKPSRFPISIAFSFLLAAVIYCTVGSAGYLMFGEGVNSMVSTFAF